MSIFPKKITHNESVIIHVRIMNDDNIAKFLQLKTYIENPNGKIIKTFKKNFILGTNSLNKTFKDFYFEFKPKKADIAGKYLARTDLYYKGEVLHSLTIDHDYFLVEKLKISKFNQINDNSCKLIVYNKSSEETEFSIENLNSLKRTKEHYIVQPFSSIEVCCSLKKMPNLYLKYGNEHYERLYSVNSKFIFYKNPRYSWIQVGNNLKLTRGNRKVILNNFDSYIWLCCNGINTISEIAEECNESKITIIKKILYLKIKGLIKISIAF